MADIKKSLWIGTADIKDLHVMVGDESVPFLGVLAKLIRRGVDVRLIHSKEPGPAFREDFAKVYVGSANLTGAGMGMKGAATRNFECGILSDEDYLIDNAAEQFNDVWTGKHCSSCRRKQFCSMPMKPEE